MSAWVVSKRHIDAMLRVGLNRHTRGDKVYWGHSGTLDLTTVDAIGEMLVQENVKSVCYRYSEPADASDLPGPVDQYWHIPYTYPSERRRMPTVVEGLNLVSCYEYQSCEHPGWEESLAHAFCRALRSFLINQLPGYDKAPWGWDEVHDREV